MTDRDLENLSSLPVPAPGEDERARALAAALTAFDAAQVNSSRVAQGNGQSARPIPVSHQGNGRKSMSSGRLNYPMAASFAALAVAVPAVLFAIGPQLVQQRLGTPPEQPTPVKTKPQVAVKGEQVKGEQAGLSAATPGVSREADITVAMGRDKVYRGSQGLDAEFLKQLAEQEAGSAGRTTLNKLGALGGPVAGERKDVPPPSAVPAPAVAQPAEKNAYIAHGKAVVAEQYKFTGEARVEPGAAVSPAKPTAGLYSAVDGMVISPHGRIAMNVPAAAYPDPYPTTQAEQGRDKHNAFEDNGVKQVAIEPVSTFSLDVDTASYAFGRRALNAGHLPQKNSVRIEEMINYFPYAYPAPESADVPFAPAVSIFPAPWNNAHKLIHIGIKGYTLQSAERPRANLVFLIDTSGSMSPQDRLPLVKNAFRLLVDQLKGDDTVGIVTYAGNTSIALRPTKAANKSEILAAIDRLGAGGSTAGAQGIQDAYALAEANFDAGGVNRIILATDGDFNVGITDQNELKSFVERKRNGGIFLSILGVGYGNHNDAMMQTLAQNGNGVAAYIDTLSEARKVLVEEASSSLFTIARDVKIQVEFNPAAVSEYRLIGYETRSLKREDFNNDKVDAGDVGSGHTVTAIYEITPVGSEAPSVDPLRYGNSTAIQRRVGNDTPPAPANEFGFLKMRYKLPKEEASKLLTIPLTTMLEKKTIADATTEARFSVAVAGFGQLLRGSPHVKSFGYDDVIALAQSAKGDDPFGYRAEFINLARLAKTARP